MNAPDEAVEAAVEAVSKSKGKLRFEDSVRLALEAAAPHLMAHSQLNAELAKAWDRGWVAAAGWPQDDHNPYRHEGKE